MSKFLNDFLVSMPALQKEKLEALLKQRQEDGYIKSEEEFKRELEKLISQLDSNENEPVFKAIHQSGQTDSETYNQNWEDISFDISTIFQASNSIDRLINNHHQISRSTLSDFRKKINIMKDKVNGFKMLIDNKESSSDVIHEYYSQPEFRETNDAILDIMRRDRFGERRSKLYEAENIGDMLQLGRIESTDQLKTNYGRKLANISVRNRIGLKAENDKYPIENAIDGSPYSFWAESVLMDDVIQQDIKDLWSHDYHDYPKTGALCEVEIELNSLSDVSELRFDPFASYPLEIVSIYGYENKNRSGKMYELISPNHKNSYQRSQKSVDQMIFQFPSVSISLIRILVRQENYTKENFIIDNDKKRETELWEALTNDEDIIKDYAEEGETIASFDRKNEVSGWNVYLNKLQEWADYYKDKGLMEAAKKAMEVIKMGDYKNPLLLTLSALDKKGEKRKVVDERSPMLEKDWLPVNKVNYLYGAYDISVYGRTHHRSSIEVTKELPVSSNTKRLWLTTEERHHYISQGAEELDFETKEPVSVSNKITDIEYYITDKRNPSTLDWTPILPGDQKFIEGELLFGNQELEICEELDKGNTINFSMRFKFVSKNTVTVRRNGIPMTGNMYILCSDNKQVGIKKEYYSPTSIYTIDYKPDPKSFYVDLSEDRQVIPQQYMDDQGRLGEHFNASDQHNTIELSHMPYLHREHLYHYNESSGKYEDDKTKLNSSNITYPLIVRVNNEEYLNVTDYKNNHLNPDDLEKNKGKTFAQIGKQLIFGQPTDGSPIENIVVDYHYITTSIRMKMIFRRNHSGYSSLTPALLSYKIKSESYDQVE